MIYISKGYISKNMKALPGEAPESDPLRAIMAMSSRPAIPVLPNSAPSSSEYLQAKNAIDNFKRNNYIYVISGEIRPREDGEYYREKKDIISRDLLIMDFDDLGPITPQEFAEPLLQSGNEFLVYCSPKHTKAHPRYRLIMRPSETITNEADYALNLRCIADTIGLPIDKQTLDWQRLMGAPIETEETYPAYYQPGQSWPVQHTPQNAPQETLQLLDAVGTQPGVTEGDTRLPEAVTLISSQAMGPYKYIQGGGIVQEGERDNSLFKYACALRGKDVPYADALQECERANNEQFLPPLTATEVRKKVDQAYKYPSGAAAALRKIVTASGMNDYGIQNNFTWPDVKVTKDGNSRILGTVENLKALLNAYGISLFYETIQRQVVIQQGRSKGFSPATLEALAVKISDDAVKLDISQWSSNRVIELLTFIARQNERNIPLERLQEAVNDYPEDSSELEKLYSAFSFTDGEKPHYRALLEKWLIQACALLENDKGTYGAQGALTLQGPQGIGKTHLGRLLCSPFGEDYYQEGLSFDGFKDKLLQATSGVICELGEAGRSFKDLNYLKATLSATKDTERRPYARLAETFPRRTSFILTVNDADFLTDDQNRRFWILPLKAIDWPTLNSVNFPALWAEAYRRWRAGGLAAFTLTAEEKQANAGMTSEHRSYTPEEIALQDRLDWSADRDRWQWRTATDIADAIGLRPDQNQYTGRGLRKMGYRKDCWQRPVRILRGRSEYLVPPALGYQPFPRFDY
ncbi:hypothetical protein HCH52_10550 [Oscillospiraceae bacterium HV4-5-C5C]|nr:hypothetical protein [Oscillospiraceae bacterium HV4-5-C5C]